MKRKENTEIKKNKQKKKTFIKTWIKNKQTNNLSHFSQQSTVH